MCEREREREKERMKVSRCLCMGVRVEAGGLCLVVEWSLVHRWRAPKREHASARIIIAACRHPHFLSPDLVQPGLTHTITQKLPYHSSLSNSSDSHSLELVNDFYALAITHALPRTTIPTPHHPPRVKSSTHLPS